jgi:phosphoglycolate phosphatase
MAKDIYLIFDFDGTIADSLPDMIQVLNELSGEYGYKKIDNTVLDVFKNKGTREFLKALEIPFYKLPLVITRVREKLAGRIAGMKSFDGLVNVLRELYRKQVRMGIVSSNSESNVRQFLKNNDMDLFDFVYAGSSLFGKDKVLRKLLQDKNLTSDDAIYIGDETRDIEAAKRCGVNMLSVTWGLNNSKVLANKNPDWIAEKPADILNYISKMNFKAKL